MKSTALKKIVALAVMLTLALCCAVTAFAEETTIDMATSPNQGVEGDIMQVMQPEELEIQLGSDFAYHGFKLDLDYGTYPETIYADEYGVLKLEIGGSDKYVIRHTGEIKDTSEETTWSDAIGSAEVADNDSEASPSEAVTENKPANNSLDRLPLGVVIAVATLAVLGVGAIFIEKMTNPKKSKKKKG